MIHAWDNYPVRQFPGLLEWMAAQISAKKLVMPSVAFEEVAHKTPECGEWLKGNGLELLEMGEFAQTDKNSHGIFGITGNCG